MGAQGLPEGQSVPPAARLRARAASIPEPLWARATPPHSQGSCFRCNNKRTAGQPELGPRPPSGTCVSSLNPQPLEQVRSCPFHIRATLLLELRKRVPCPGAWPRQDSYLGNRLQAVGSAARQCAHCASGASPRGQTPSPWLLGPEGSARRQGRPQQSRRIRTGRGGTELLSTQPEYGLLRPPRKA